MGKKKLKLEIKTAYNTKQLRTNLKFFLNNTVTLC